MFTFELLRRGTCGCYHFHHLELSPICQSNPFLLQRLIMPSYMPIIASNRGKAPLGKFFPGIATLGKSTIRSTWNRIFFRLNKNSSFRYLSEGSVEKYHYQKIRGDVSSRLSWFPGAKLLVSFREGKIREEFWSVNFRQTLRAWHPKLWQPHGPRLAESSFSPRKKNRGRTRLPWNTGCLIGILIISYISYISL